MATPLHPELARLVEIYIELRDHVTNGELTPADAAATLHSLMTIDGEGYQWRINADGRFERSLPSEIAMVTDPLLYAPAQLPGPDEGAPFPYTVHAGEEESSTLDRWKEIRAVNHGEEPERQQWLLWIHSTATTLLARLREQSVRVGLHSIDSLEGRWQRNARGLILGLLVTGIVLAYLPNMPTVTPRATPAPTGSPASPGPSPTGSPSASTLNVTLPAEGGAVPTEVLHSTLLVALDRSTPTATLLGLLQPAVSTLGRGNVWSLTDATQILNTGGSAQCTAAVAQDLPEQDPNPELGQRATSTCTISSADASRGPTTLRFTWSASQDQWLLHRWPTT
jgi:hypothetical protein